MIFFRFPPSKVGGSAKESKRMGLDNILKYLLHIIENAFELKVSTIFLFNYSKIISYSINVNILFLCHLKIDELQPLPVLVLEVLSDPIVDFRSADFRIR